MDCETPPDNDVDGVPPTFDVRSNWTREVSLRSLCFPSSPSEIGLARSPPSDLCWCVDWTRDSDGDVSHVQPLFVVS